MTPASCICVLYSAPLRDLCAAAKRQREGLKNPPRTVDEYLAALERQGFAQTVSVFRQFGDLI